MDDIRQSVEELRFYREHVFVNPVAPSQIAEPTADL
jgi:hypothetical protein